MPEANDASRRQRAQAYLLCYGLYLLLLALAVLALFIWRSTILALIGALMGRGAANSLIYFGSLTLMGFLLFLLIIGGEPYLRGGVEQRQLLRRFIRLAVPLVVAIVLAVLLRGLAVAFIR